MLESISPCGMKILLHNLKQMKAFPVFSLQQEKGAALSYLNFFFEYCCYKKLLNIHLLTSNVSHKHKPL